MSNSHRAVSSISKSIGALMLLSEPVPREMGTSRLAGISATRPAVGQRRNTAASAIPSRPTSNSVARRGGSTKAATTTASGTAMTRPQRSRRCFLASVGR